MARTPEAAVGVAPTYVTDQTEHKPKAASKESSRITLRSDLLEGRTMLLRGDNESDLARAAFLAEPHARNIVALGRPNAGSKLPWVVHRGLTML